MDCPGSGGRRAGHDAVAGDRAQRRQLAAARGVAATRCGVRHGQDRLRRAGRREEADHRRDQRHGGRARPALAVLRQEIVEGIPRRHDRPLRRRRHRDRHGRRSGQGRLADRRLAGVSRRPEERRPDHQDRRHRGQGPDARPGRQAHARRAEHQGRADDVPQVREPHLPGHHRARGNPHGQRARQGGRAGLRVAARQPVPGPHGRGLRAQARRALQAGPQPEGHRARSAQRPGRPARSVGGDLGGVPAERRDGGLDQRPDRRLEVDLQGLARVLPCAAAAPIRCGACPKR